MEAVIVAVLAIIILFIVMIVPRKMAKKSSMLGSSRMTEEMKMRETMEKILVDLQEISREMNARLDTKMKILNQLIEEADEKIAKLKELNSESDKTTELKKDKNDVSKKPLENKDKTEEEIPETHKEIYKLSDGGVGTLEIARKVGIPRGEVELILSLRKKR